MGGRVWVVEGSWGERERPGEGGRETRRSGKRDLETGKQKWGREKFGGGSGWEQKEVGERHAHTQRNIQREGDRGRDPQREAERLGEGGVGEGGKGEDGGAGSG